MENDEDAQVLARTRAIDIVRRLHVTQPGWSWDAVPVDGAPDWYSVWQHGDQPLDILIGGGTLVGPDGTVVNLSSNPGIHGFTQTAAVLAELGDAGLSGVDLAAEIQRRTEAARG